METVYHVYELPERNKLSRGFAFNGGNEIAFLNVDWFSGTYPLTGEAASKGAVEEMVSTKRYIKPGRRYLILGSPGHTFVLEPPTPDAPASDGEG